MLLPFHTKSRNEVGCDEAGRGCLAGPVVAAAVMLPEDFQDSLLDDSKKLSEKKRRLLRDTIESKAIAYAVAFVSEKEIDEINILNASFLAMHRALDDIDSIFNHILVDGNRFTPYGEFQHTCIVKGDGKYASIAAASILAKTYRDEYMEKIHHECPEYDWVQNKGYPTKKHRLAVEQFGRSIHHRITFKVNKQLNLNL